jgi:hypothetical protein
MYTREIANRKEMFIEGVTPAVEGGTGTAGVLVFPVSGHAKSFIDQSL